MKPYLIIAICLLLPLTTTAKDKNKGNQLPKVTSYDREGKRYGWGVARYTTPELMYGEEMFNVDRTPEKSLQRIITHLNKKLPYAAEWQIEKIIVG